MKKWQTKICNNLTNTNINTNMNTNTSTITNINTNSNKTAVNCANSAHAESSTVDVTIVMRDDGRNVKIELDSAQAEFAIMEKGGYICLQHSQQLSFSVDIHFIPHNTLNCYT